MVYGNSHRSLIGAKPLHISFDNVDGFIKVYDGTRHLLYFGPEKFDAIYNKIRYLIDQKRGIYYIRYFS